MTLFDASLFKIPKDATVCLLGSSGSGKSTLIRRMLENSKNYFESPADCSIFYYYTYLEPELIALKEKLGNRLQLFENSADHILAEQHLADNVTPKYSILVVEDTQSDALCAGSQDLRRSLLRLYQGSGRHYPCVVISTHQSVFSNSDITRLIIRNSTILIFCVEFRLLRLSSQISQQLFRNGKLLPEIFSTLPAYSNLLIDCGPQTPTVLRIRSVGANPGEIIVYEPTKPIF